MKLQTLIIMLAVMMSSGCYQMLQKDAKPESKPRQETGVEGVRKYEDKETGVTCYTLWADAISCVKVK